MFLIFSLIRRKENARLWLLRLMPFFYFFAVSEGLKGFFKADIEATSSLSIAILINVILFAIPLGAIYFFYKRENVKKYIFEMKEI